MKKSIKTGVFMTIALYGPHPVDSVLASDAEMEALNKQVQELVILNEQLHTKMGALDQTTHQEKNDRQPATGSPLTRPPEQVAIEHQGMEEEITIGEGGDRKGRKINEFIALSGLIEGEFSTGDDFSGENFSEFTMASVELGLDVNLNTWSKGQILALYEGGEDDELTMDEALLILGDTARFPFELTAGKFYLPFGRYDTNMIQDPLTLELGEINDAGIALEFQQNGLYASLFAGNGIKERGGKAVNTFGAMASYLFERDSFTLDAGLSWTSNLASSKGISAYFDGAGIEEVDSFVSGISVHFMATTGPFSLAGEYTGALEHFFPGTADPESGEISNAELVSKGQGARPSARNVELAYTTVILERETVVALGYQASSEAVSLGLPENRLIGTVSMNILPGTALAIEYRHDRDYDRDESGSDTAADVLTAQLSYEF